MLYMHYVEYFDALDVIDYQWILLYYDVVIKCCICCWVFNNDVRLCICTICVIYEAYVDAMFKMLLIIIWCCYIAMLLWYEFISAAYVAVDLIKVVSVGLSCKVVRVVHI
jgi:hypothetical protein